MVPNSRRASRLYRFCVAVRMYPAYNPYNRASPILTKWGLPRRRLRKRQPLRQATAEDPALAALLSPALRD